MNKHVSKAFGAFFLLLELALVPIAIDMMLDQPFSSLSRLQIVVMSMTFGSIALCILMSFSSLSENSSYPLPAFLFELMVFLCCLAPITELVTRVLNTSERPALNMAVNTVFYLIGLFIAYILLRYEFLIIGIGEKPTLKKLRNIATLLMILDTLATLLNIKFGYFFTITESGIYHSAPTFWLAYAAPVLILATTFVTAIREMRPSRQQRAFLFFWAFALLSSMIQFFRSELSVQYTGYTLSLIVIYLNIQSELDTSISSDLEHN